MHTPTILHRYHVTRLQPLLGRSISPRRHLYLFQHNDTAKINPACIGINATRKKVPRQSSREVELYDKATPVREVLNIATLDTGGPVHVSAHEAEQVKASKIYEIIAKCVVSKFLINLYSLMSSSDFLILKVASKFAALVLKVSQLF